MLICADQIDGFDTSGLNPKDVSVFMGVKLRALISISKFCQFFPKSEEEAAVRRAEVDQSVIWLAMAVMMSGRFPAWQRAACAAILDLLFFDWRKGAPVEALGYVVDRDSPEVRAWRKVVLARDGYACVECGETTNLEAHHVVRWADSPELRVDPDNGMTLCSDCHLAAHGRKRH